MRTSAWRTSPPWSFDYHPPPESTCFTRSPSFCRARRSTSPGGLSLVGEDCRRDCHRNQKAESRPSWMLDRDCGELLAVIIETTRGARGGS